ncbi:hypothetical protein [Alcaligenes sp. Marseille-Q7550]
MTRKLYLNSHDLQGQAIVLDCRPAGDDRYAIRLDQTLFHPQGGGQPSDGGYLNDLPVLHVMQDEHGHVIHLVTEPLPPGPATMRVDAPRRERHARLHTAGHLIGHILARAGWRPIKAHHWPGECKVVLAGPGADHLPDPDWLQGACAAAILRNLPVQAILQEDGRRTVRIQDLGDFPCAGTHVRGTGELDGLQIVSVQFKKDTLTVRYDLASEA